VDKSVDVRFIEYMPFDGNRSRAPGDRTAEAALWSRAARCGCVLRWVAACSHAGSARQMGRLQTRSVCGNAGRDQSALPGLLPPRVARQAKRHVQGVGGARR